MRGFALALAAVGLAALGFAVYAADTGKGGAKVNTRVYELRTYYAAPGKAEAMHARFRNHTCKLFEKHGITLIGFWTPTDPSKKDQLVYMLAFPSMEAAKKSWQAFRDDPAWVAAKTASEKDGKLVDKIESVYLNPTDYSPIK